MQCWGGGDFSYQLFNMWSSQIESGRFEGRVVAIEAIPKGSFVCEYVGKMLNFAQIKAAENAYAAGSWMLHVLW